MIKMGFLQVMVELIWRCISTVRYSFQINGAVVGDLVPHRGIRQGDQLSPYLFALTTQALSATLTGYVDAGLIRVLKIAVIGPVISHRSVVRR